MIVVTIDAPTVCGASQLLDHGQSLKKSVELGIKDQRLYLHLYICICMQ